MTKTLKQSLALLLVLVQLFALLPLGMTTARATGSETETPVLNKTIVGTVRFQSFNFLGDNDTGEDGTDYKTTFYYTDDYFSPSAINAKATAQSMPWSALENTSLAACSMEFAVASMTTAAGDVVAQSSRTWNNTDFDGSRGKADSTYGKAANAVHFLQDCGFENIEPNGLNAKPTNDSIGFTIASKEITVWNADTQRNETYTLVAVGCRGAGYGSEWASNVTIGDPSTGAIPANGRHYGFDHSADIVCEGIRQYLSKYGITENVKYWVTGFSRAAAVANLVAGKLTDGAASAYHTQQKDVYGYTWECPQAASTSENALNYKNIHNIINAMDAVPKVSPSAFQHQRLGVDYVMPYYKNTSTTTVNNTYYNRMYNVLKTIAVGNGTKTDPLVNDPDKSGADDGYVSPNVYPVNSTMTIYKMSVSQLLTDALRGDLMTNFGTEEAEQKHKGGLFNLQTIGNVDKLLGYGNNGNYSTTTWHIDDFIDGLVNVFLTSNAWVGGTGTSRTAMQNRATFISDFQSDFRTLFGYFLDFSGPAFMDLLDKLIEAVEAQFKIQNAGFAWDLLRFYNDPTSTSKKNNLISSAKEVAVEVANDLTSGYPDNENQHHTRAEMNAALQHLAELVINLYSYELSEYNSQYLGTTLRYVWEILCTHEQETVLAWIMSLDQNHMNRSTRTVTIPAGCSATLYEYRPEFEGNLTNLNVQANLEAALDTNAPVVAEVKDGTIVAETLKDQRIYAAQDNSGNTVVRYPASLQIRVDVKMDSAFNASAVQVADYRLSNDYINVSKGPNQFKTIALTSTSNGYSAVISSTATNVTATNNLLKNYGTLDAGDTLHILADDIATYSQSNTSTYTLAIDKAPNVTVLDYAAPSADMNGSNTAETGALTLDANTSTTDVLEGKTILTRQKHITVPASSIYFDDDFSEPVTGKDFGDSVYSVNSQQVDTSSGSKQLWFTFSGSRIDVYCTTDSNTGYVQAAVYENNDGERGERKGLMTIRSSSTPTRYNVPTISFDGLEAGKTYYLALNVLSSSNYKLDGIRVYNPTNAASTAEFFNVRALLLPSENAEAPTEVEGVAYYKTEGETNTSMVTDTYKKDGPKQEVYLGNGESVAFRVNGSYDVAVGLSTPENNGGGRIIVSNGSNATTTIDDLNVVDTYRDITPDNGNVVITNNSDDMVAVTNIRLTPRVRLGVTKAPIVVNPELRSYAANFLTLAAAPVIEPEETMPVETIVPEETAAPEETAVPEETAAPTPTPAPTAVPTQTPAPTPAPTPSTSQVISRFVSALFGGISRLFKF